MAEKLTMLQSTCQEMDIESLEAANQSFQVDLKLAFKRIGDLQAAIEDEMESDDNDDLINRYSVALIYYKGYSCYFCSFLITSYIISWCNFLQRESLVLS